MFFEMMNVPATFQKAIDQIFVKLKNHYLGCIFIYIDNILIVINNNEKLHE